MLWQRKIQKEKWRSGTFGKRGNKDVNTMIETHLKRSLNDSVKNIFGKTRTRGIYTAVVSKRAVSAICMTFELSIRNASLSDTASMY